MSHREISHTKTLNMRWSSTFVSLHDKLDGLILKIRLDIDFALDKILELLIITPIWLQFWFCKKIYNASFQPEHATFIETLRVAFSGFFFMLAGSQI
jgi:hypothetical protein